MKQNSYDTSRFKRISRMHREYHTYKAHTLERIILNLCESHRNLTELAQYYNVPRSTLYTWLCSSINYVSYDLYMRMRSALVLHKLKSVNMINHGECFYYTQDIDGELD